MAENKRPETIEEYLEGCEPEVARRLEVLRALVREVAPEATEHISWGMPTWKVNGNLVHFAAHKQHIGFYPGPEGVEFAKDLLGDIGHTKGAIQLRHDRDLPLELVRAVVEWRTEVQRAKEPKKPKRTKRAKPSADGAPEASD